ncbi:MAG: PilW family protein [Deltaproteobacteria bacterium]|nr:PilW family protein [Deltaproteobacteria bacterium]
MLSGDTNPVGSVKKRIHKEEREMKRKAESGFTLVELLVAIALGIVILAGLYQTFRTQHDSYIVQDQVAAMQQNLRAAMYMITRDLQMAGWYSNFDRSNHSIDPAGLNMNGKPLIFSTPPGTAGNIKDGTDALAIVKAGDGPRELAAGEWARGTTLSFDLSASGLNTGSRKYGLLVKNDLRTGDFFDVTQPNLSENYVAPDDMVFRADVIIYKISNDATTGQPILYRKNLGNDNGYQPVAENIDNMQVSYQILNPKTKNLEWVNTLDAKNQGQVRSVEVVLVGRTAHRQRGYTDTNTYAFPNDPDANYTPNDHYRRKTFSTIVKTRNVGL